MSSSGARRWGPVRCWPRAATTTGAAATTTGGGTETTAGGSTETTTGGTTETTAAAGDVKRGGTLRVGLVGSTNDIIDGQYIVTKADQARLVLGWEGLVHYDSDFNLSYEHALAESIDAVAPDHYIVHLKSGITWHDGKPLTADDVVYSFQRRLNPESDVKLGSLVALLDNDGVTKVDDLTVDIKLLQGAVTFLNVLAEYTLTVVPVGYTRAGEQIGTGPFKLKSFTPGSESVHVRNENYWGADIPYLDEVQIIDFADATAMINALKSGDVDVIADVPFAWPTAWRATGSPSWSPGRQLADHHDGHRPGADGQPKIRQAMRLICDRRRW